MRWLSPTRAGEEGFELEFAQISEVQLDIVSYTSGAALISSDIGGSPEHEQG
jgi:hypothetical protein